MMSRKEAMALFKNYKAKADRKTVEKYLKAKAKEMANLEAQAAAHTNSKALRAKMLKDYKSGPSRPKPKPKPKAKPAKVEAKRDRGVTAPAAVAHTYHTPGVSNKLAGSTITITRSEILKLAVTPSTSSFELTSYEINPGNSLMFSWLYPLARRYEMYRFVSLSFVYHPSCASSADGRVVMAFEPNFDDPDPTSLLETQSIGGAVGFSPWTSASMHVPKKLLSRQGTNALYVIHADAETPTTETSVGRLHIATGGASSSIETGFITVQYKVQLNVAQIHDYLVGGYLRLHATITTTNNTTWLNDSTVSTYSNMQDWGVTWEDDTVSFPANIVGKFHVFVFCNSNGATSELSGGLTVTGGVTVHSAWKQGNGSYSSSVISPATTSQGYSAMVGYDIHIDGTEGTMQIPTPASVEGTTGSAYLLIHELSKHHDTVEAKSGMNRNNKTLRMDSHPVREFQEDPDVSEFYTVSTGGTAPSAPTSTSR